MGSGGSTPLAYCHLQALIKSKCSILNGPSPNEDNGTDMNIVLKVEDKGCWKDAGDRAVPKNLGTGYCGEKGWNKCMAKALVKNWNTFSIQWPQGGCQCFIGNSPDYEKHGKSTKCNNKGEGGSWAGNIYVIS